MEILREIPRVFLYSNELERLDNRIYTVKITVGNTKVYVGIAFLSTMD